MSCYELLLLLLLLAQPTKEVHALQVIELMWMSWSKWIDFRIQAFHGVFFSFHPEMGSVLNFTLTIPCPCQHELLTTALARMFFQDPCLDFFMKLEHQVKKRKPRDYDCTLTCPERSLDPGLEQLQQLGLLSNERYMIWVKRILQKTHWETAKKIDKNQ